MEPSQPQFVRVAHVSESEADGQVTIKQVACNLEIAEPSNGWVVGIDPGQVNMGVTVLNHKFAWLFQIKLPSTEDATERILNTLNVVKYVIETVRTGHIDCACIEQAAYAALYGQASLAENRTAALIALSLMGTTHIDLAAPGQIRKEVFGSGKLKGEICWPHLPPDAASSLGCALYAHKRLATIYV